MQGGRTGEDEGECGVQIGFQMWLHLFLSCFTLHDVVKNEITLIGLNKQLSKGLWFCYHLESLGSLRKTVVVLFACCHATDLGRRES